MLSVAVLLTLFVGTVLFSALFWVEAALLEAHAAWRAWAEDRAEVEFLGETVALGCLADPREHVGGSVPESVQALLDASAAVGAPWTVEWTGRFPSDPFDASGVPAAFAAPGWGARLTRFLADEPVVVHSPCVLRLRRPAPPGGGRPLVCRIDLLPVSVPITAWDLVAYGPDAGGWSWPGAWSGAGVRTLRAGSERAVPAGLLANAVTGAGFEAWLAPGSWQRWRDMPGAWIRDLASESATPGVERLAPGRWRVEGGVAAGRTLVLEDRAGGASVELVGFSEMTPVRLVLLNDTVAPTKLLLTSLVAGMLILHNAVVEASGSAEVRGGLVLAGGSRVQGALSVAGLLAFPAAEGMPSGIAWRRDVSARRGVAALAPRGVVAGWSAEVEP